MKGATKLVANAICTMAFLIGELEETGHSSQQVHQQSTGSSEMR